VDQCRDDDGADPEGQRAARVEDGHAEAEMPAGIGGNHPGDRRVKEDWPMEPIETNSIRTRKLGATPPADEDERQDGAAEDEKTGAVSGRPGIRRSAGR